MITVSTIYPGASAEDVELEVTNKLEEALSNVDNIKRIVSSSVENLSQIILDIPLESKILDAILNTFVLGTFMTF